MMSIDCILVVPVCCLGSDLAGQASGVVSVEQSVIVVFGQVVKEIKLEYCCTSASTPGVVHSTEIMAEHMIETIGWMAMNDTEIQRTKEEV